MFGTRFPRKFAKAPKIHGTWFLGLGTYRKFLVKPEKTTGQRASDSVTASTAVEPCIYRYFLNISSKKYQKNTSLSSLPIKPPKIVKPKDRRRKRSQNMLPPHSRFCSQFNERRSLGLHSCLSHVAVTVQKLATHYLQEEQQQQVRCPAAMPCGEV